MTNDSPSDSVGPRELPLCDIVMEGGVTSGVIYPAAVVELSKQFRLKNIGGTSVGALAAALAAAAEVWRARDPEHHGGFKLLEGLPGTLQEPGFSGAAATRLFNLFQPQPTTRALFNILASALNRPTKKSLLAYALMAAIRNFGPEFWLVLAVLTAIQSIAGIAGVLHWVVAILFGVACALGAVGYAVWKAMTEPFVANGFGLCTGHVNNCEEQLAPNDIREPLTLWLSRLINQYAGKPADGEPLTFGELWNPTGDARSGPPDWLKTGGSVKEWHYIDLQMIATNLTHGRPYRFPYDDEDQQLFFRPAELKDWFPKKVLEHMRQHAQTYAPRAATQPQTLPDGLLMLPRSEDLPVVFAARLSLSFPFLLSAIPLYALDYEPENVADRQFKRCWFSDGGICSDFPIHFFDAPLPLWPTFGIKLEQELKFRRIDEPTKSANRIFLPSTNEKGRGDSMARFDDALTGSARLTGFMGAMLNSARKWRDSMLLRGPAIRDRVARVYLKPQEGGLNLNMPKEVQQELSTAGADSAAKLVERYRPGSVHYMNFDNHRWVRLRRLTRVLEADMPSMHKALSVVQPGVTTWANLIALPRHKSDQYPANAMQQLKMRGLMLRLGKLSATADDQGDLLKEHAPRRESVIRIVPDI